MSSGASVDLAKVRQRARQACDSCRNKKTQVSLISVPIDESVWTVFLVLNGSSMRDFASLQANFTREG